MEMLAGPSAADHSRKPEIIADAAYTIFLNDPQSKDCPTGQFFIDEELLGKAGVTDFGQYACNAQFKDDLHLDFFLPEKYFADSQQILDSRGGTPAAAPPKEGGGFPDTMVGRIFTAIEGRLSEQLVQSTQSVYEFELTGAEAGKWFVDLKNGKGSCGNGDAPAKPDATLRMDSKHFAEMFSGKLKPATAYMMGKLKITGNLQKALKLEALMKGLKSKM